jgi:hypothetical protein
MPSNNYLKKSQDYLSRGKVKESLSLLKENVKEKDILNQVLQLEIRYNNLMRKINSGTIDGNDAQLEENRISNSTLLIISNLATEKKEFAITEPSKKSFDYKWLIIGLMAMAILAFGVYVINSGGTATSSVVTDPCEQISCLNGGVCKDGTCECPPGFSGERCQIKVNESNEKQPVSKLAQPDLKVTGFQVNPSTPVQGERVSVQAVIKNIGDAKSGVYEIKWWGGVNFPEPAFQEKYPGLNAGAEKVINFQYEGYKSWYGTITSKLEIDANNGFIESNMDNNTFTKSFPVKKKSTTNTSAGKPDLKITDFQMKPQTPVQGKKVYMQAIVKNMGNAKSGNFEIEWWGGVNFPKPAFQKKFNGLNPGEQKIFSFQYDGYKSWYGRITSKLVIDADNVVKESNESNNVLEMTHPVKKK